MPTETERNFDSFDAKFQSELADSLKQLGAYRAEFLESYSRLTVLNAWRQSLLKNILSPDSLEFFLEAQNDALVSHVFARCGAWRSSLQSLRACVENVAFCLFYKDHPVELKLWKTKGFRKGFVSIHEYLEAHPDFDGLDAKLTGLTPLLAEYKTLSRAVHGSPAFRMTVTNQTTQLWRPDPIPLRMWLARQRETVGSLTLVLLVMFREHLQGTKLPSLRQAIRGSTNPSLHAEIKSSLSVVL